MSQMGPVKSLCEARQARNKTVYDFNTAGNGCKVLLKEYKKAFVMSESGNKMYKNTTRNSP